MLPYYFYQGSALNEEESPLLKHAELPQNDVAPHVLAPQLGDLVIGRGVRGDLNWKFENLNFPPKSEKKQRVHLPPISTAGRCRGATSRRSCSPRPRRARSRNGTSCQSEMKRLKERGLRRKRKHQTQVTESVAVSPTFVSYTFWPH